METGIHTGKGLRNAYRCAKAAGTVLSCKQWLATLQAPLLIIAVNAWQKNKQEDAQMVSRKVSVHRPRASASKKEEKQNRKTGKKGKKE